MIEELINECINILKEHYHIRYGKDEGVLLLTTNKFNPELAKEFGITTGSMFGALARGESVTIKNKTIKPDMVYTTTEKVIRVKNIDIVK
jgi:D-aminoacyl-tRNA deacylase